VTLPITARSRYLDFACGTSTAERSEMVARALLDTVWMHREADRTTTRATLQGIAANHPVASIQSRAKRAARQPAAGLRKKPGHSMKTSPVPAFAFFTLIAVAGSADAAARST
jgi:hypothetical protein